MSATRKIILVINDGSDDDTGDVLASIAGARPGGPHPRRPDARVGKAAALNAAFEHVERTILAKPAYRDIDPSRVIFGIVDADGRLAPRHLRPSPGIRGPRGRWCAGARAHLQPDQLAHPHAGPGFPIFGGCIRSGTLLVGHRFPGGNGQFNRMTALRSVASDEGPWSHYLTEDQELGLRCLAHGWRGEHEPDTQVAQQGLNDLRRLYRQRGRWFQGNLQVLKDFGRLNGHDCTGSGAWTWRSPWDFRSCR